MKFPSAHVDNPDVIDMRGADQDVVHMSRNDPIDTRRADMPTNNKNRLTHLRTIVELHNDFWHELLQRQPGNSALLAFVADAWVPWHMRWTSLPESAFYTADGDADPALIREAAEGLASLRELAQSCGVSLPDLGTSRRGIVRADGWDSQHDVAYQRGLRQGIGHYTLRNSEVQSSGAPNVGRRFGGAGTASRPPYYAPYQEIAQPPTPALAPYPYECQGPEHVVEVVPGVPTAVALANPAPATMSGAELADVGHHHRAHAAATAPGADDLASAASIITPGARGISVNFDVDATGRLHAALYIDGQCYHGSADIAPLLSYLASSPYHALGPPLDPGDPAAPAAADPAAAAAVEAAGDMLIGAMLDRHCATVSAGWWSSVTHGISSAAHGVYNAGRVSYNTTTGVVQKFKVPIAIAATVVATAYGGPAAGAAAGRLVGPIIDAAHDGFNKPEAKAVVDQVKEEAKTNPQTAQAFDAAQKAVSHTVAAYHIVDTASNALGGDKGAIKKIAELGKAATSGDSSASKAMGMIFDALKSYGGDGGGGDDGGGGGGGGDGDTTYDVSSGAESSPSEQDVQALVTDMAARSGAPFIGYLREPSATPPRRGSHGSVVTMSDTESTFPFGSEAEVVQWVDGFSGKNVHAAGYDTQVPVYPRLVAAVEPDRSHVGAWGALPWLALGAGAGVGFTWWHRSRDHRRKAQRAQRLAEQDRVLNAQADAAIAAANGSPTDVRGLLPWLALGAGAAGVGAYAWWHRRRAEHEHQGAVDAAVRGESW